jgi:D-galactose 1-dehydrogenase
VTPIDIAIIGFGKIAADEHVPAIEANERLHLAATSSRSGMGPKPAFTDYRQLLREVDGLQAVAITTPPGPRTSIAAECIEAGLHVLLEKPPAATLGEIESLSGLAAKRGVTLFATWHARHNPAVSAAAHLLAGQRIAAMEIKWHEDVRKWHPGQDWVWEPGGFGVFDPGINAFSIATAIFPGPLFVHSADLHVPQNAQTPIAVDAEFHSPAADGRLTCSLDWRRTEGEEWTIRIETGSGQRIELGEGGKTLTVDGQPRRCDGPGEYPDIYARFVELIDQRQSDVDVAPLRLVADALLVGRTHRVAEFDRAG